MFDVTNKLSFESLDYWLQEFTSNGGKQAVMAVVANKVRITHFVLPGEEEDHLHPWKIQQKVLRNMQET